MPQAYFSLVTTAGKIKLAQSAAGGSPVVITHFGIGDGNGAETNPTAASTTLVHEVWRAPVESVVTDPENPSAILVTAIIPTTAGGWWMREFGVFDQAGTMIAVAKPVSQYKPTAAEGQLEDIRYEFQIIIGETANVALLVDPSLLFATRSWVESRKIPMAQLMGLPWLPVLSMVTTAPPAAPTLGDIYLIPAGATGDWAAKTGSLAEWKGTAWNYISPPNGHGVSLPDGRVFVRVGGTYVEKIALDVQSGKWSFAAATGTGDAWVINPTLAVTAYSAGRILWVIAPGTNTATTVNANISGLGNRRIKKANGNDPRPGDIVSGTAYPTMDDGTNIRILSPLPSDRLAAKYLGFHGDPTAIAVPNNTLTRISAFAGTPVNNMPGASYASGVITIATEGFYLCTANMAFLMPSGSNYGFCLAISKVDGSNAPILSVASNQVTVSTASLPSNLNSSATAIAKLAAGDRIAAFFTHNQGASQNVSISLDINFMGAP